jgi:hypothetical protein
MGAALVYEPEPALAVLEQRQTLAKELHRLHGVALQFDVHGNRIPVATQEVSAGRARPDAGQSIVLLCA